MRCDFVHVMLERVLIISVQKHAVKNDLLSTKTLPDELLAELPLPFCLDPWTGNVDILQGVAIVRWKCIV